MRTTKMMSELAALTMVTMLTAVSAKAEVEPTRSAPDEVETAIVLNEDRQDSKVIGVAVVLKGIFSVVEVVGEIAGGVFDTMHQMGTEQALGQLIEGVAEINGKLDAIQVQLNSIEQQITNIEVAMKLNTDKIINQIIQPKVHERVSGINSIYQELADKIKTFNNKTQAEKEADFRSGAYTQMIKDCCSETKVSALKGHMTTLIDLMVANASYTGALDAYTQVLINRVTIPEKGQTYPSHTVEDAYNFLAHYYADKVTVIYRGVAFIQNYYYANENAAEFFTYFENLQNNYLKKLSAKYHQTVNNLILAQANFRSVNDTSYRNLFMDVQRNGTVVYSKDIIDGILKNADLVACVSSDLKYKGTTTVRDDQGNTQTVTSLVNRKVLGVFLRHFAEPSRAATGASITSGGKPVAMTKSTFYRDVIGAPYHIDWQGDQVEENYTHIWKKEHSLNMALYNHMAEDMATAGTCALTVNGVSTPVTSNYQLAEYDLTTGEAATSSTEEKNKAKLAYVYNYDNTDRGYHVYNWGGWHRLAAKVQSRGWGGESNLPFAYNLDAAKGQYSVTVNGRYTGLLMLGKFWEYHLNPSNAGKGVFWKNIGDVARLSARDNFYFWMQTDRQMSKYWLAYELKPGLVSARPDTVGGGPADFDLNWILTSSAPNAGLTHFAGKFENQDSSEQIFSVWPRMQMGANDTAQIVTSCYQYLWTRWGWGWAEKLFTSLKFGSQTGQYELMVDVQERPDAWAGPINRSRDRTDAAYYVINLNGKNKIHDLVEMSIPSSLESITLGDFNGDYQNDLLLLDADTMILSYASINIDQETAMTESDKKGKNPSRRHRGKHATSRIIEPTINQITVLDEGDQIIDVGCFNNDMTDDILIENVDGEYRILSINCGVVSEEGEALTDLPAGDVVGSGDFNGDLLEDLLFYDLDTDTYAIRFVDDDGVVSTYEIPTYDLGGEDFSLFAIDDANGDEIDDLIWNGDETGEVFLTIFSIEGKVDQIGAPDFKNDPWNRGWTLVDASDYNLDGKTDYLWEPLEEEKQANKGKLFVSYMDGFVTAKSKNAKSGMIKLDFNPGARFIK